MVFGCAGPDELYPDWKRDFGRAAPLELEIGPGRGAFALGAMVDFRTDVAAYAREGERTWLQAGFERLPDEPPEVLSTRERRYAVTGQPVFRARFRNPPADLRPIQSERTGREWRDLRRK